MTEPKIEIGVKYLRYLGHIVSHSEVFSDPKKVEAIMEMPEPRTRRHAQLSAKLVGGAQLGPLSHQVGPQQRHHRVFSRYSAAVRQATCALQQILILPEIACRKTCGVPPLESENDSFALNHFERKFWIHRGDIMQHPTAVDRARGPQR